MLFWWRTFLLVKLFAWQPHVLPLTPLWAFSYVVWCSASLWHWLLLGVVACITGGGGLSFAYVAFVFPQHLSHRLYHQWAQIIFNTLWWVLLLIHQTLIKHLLPGNAWLWRSQGETNQVLPFPEHKVHQSYGERIKHLLCGQKHATGW